MSAFLTRITLVRDAASTLDTTLSRQTALLTLVGGGLQGPPGELGGEVAADIDMLEFDLHNAGVVSFVGEYDNGLSGAAKPIVLAVGTKQKVVVDTDTVLTIDPVTAGVGHYQVRIIMDGFGGHTVTIAGINNARWLGSASAPDVNTSPNGESILSIFLDGANMIQSLAKVGA